MEWEYTGVAALPTPPPPDADPQTDHRRVIIDALRRYGTDSTRLGHAFSARNDLRPVDLLALVAIMSAERAGQPLTPGTLRPHLQLSSAGTSYVIDRLQDAGHVRRSRETSNDNRVVHLHHTQQGLHTAHSFFGPLGTATEQALAQFDERELDVIERFMTAVGTALHDYVQTLTEDC